MFRYSSRLRSTTILRPHCWQYCIHLGHACCPVSEYLRRHDTVISPADSDRFFWIRSLSVTSKSSVAEITFVVFDSASSSNTPHIQSHVLLQILRQLFPRQNIAHCYTTTGSEQAEYLIERKLFFLLRNKINNAVTNNAVGS